MKKAKKKSFKAQINVNENLHMPEVDQPKIQPKIEIAWQAPEYEYRQKDISWYWISVIFAILLIAFSIWQKNFLFAIFIVIAWLTIVNFAKRVPTTWEFIINEKGIELKLPDRKKDDLKKNYSYKDIKGFDIWSSSDKYSELVLGLKPRFSTYLKIKIPTEREEEINKFLEKFLRREKYIDSVSDSLSKLIGF